METFCDEYGGTLGDEDWADVLARSTEPPEDPVAYADECEAMGEE